MQRRLSPTPLVCRDLLSRSPPRPQQPFLSSDLVVSLRRWLVVPRVFPTSTIALQLLSVDPRRPGPVTFVVQSVRRSDPTAATMLWRRNLFVLRVECFQIR